MHIQSLAKQYRVLVFPPPPQQVSLGELIQLSENRLKVNHAESESDIKETTFSDHSLSVSSIVRQISDPKLEKKVTFARLLSKVSAEISSGSDDLTNVSTHSGDGHCSARSCWIRFALVTTTTTTIITD